MTRVWPWRGSGSTRRRVRKARPSSLLSRPVAGIRLPGGPGQENGVAGTEQGGRPAEVEVGRAGAGTLRLTLAGPEGVPGGAGLDPLHRLEGLRALALPGDAEHPHPGVDGGPPGGPGRPLHGEGQVGPGGDPGGQLVADGAGQLQHRAALRGRAQVALVGDPLLVEGDHVQHGRPGVEEGDGGIVGRPGGQGPGPPGPGQLAPEGGREAGQEAAQGLRVGGRAVADGGLPRAVVAGGRVEDVLPSARGAAGAKAAGAPSPTRPLARRSRSARSRAGWGRCPGGRSPAGRR